MDLVSHGMHQIVPNFKHNPMQLAPWASSADDRRPSAAVDWLLVTASGLVIHWKCSISGPIQQDARPMSSVDDAARTEGLLPNVAFSLTQKPDGSLTLVRYSKNFQDFIRRRWSAGPFHHENICTTQLDREEVGCLRAQMTDAGHHVQQSHNSDRPLNQQLSRAVSGQRSLERPIGRPPSLELRCRLSGHSGFVECV